MNKKNIILADCDPEEVKTFSEGCNAIATDANFKILSLVNKISYNGVFKEAIRYLQYFIFPFRIFLNRKKYNVILGWQQFYAINFAFFCRLFHVNKCNTNVVVNFTYKRKSGITGKIYYSYMKYCCQNKYIDYFHVPSYNYVDICCKELGINKNKFIVTGFGVPDTYENMKYLKTPMKNYSLSIGRSNRDFNFLVNVWKQDCMKDKILVIASDTWRPIEQLPKNVIHKTNIKYKDSFAWFNNCNLCIIPISDGTICSGDTVLLTGMMFGKPTVITKPSTLAEMYIEDGINGICVEKNVKTAALTISDFLNDKNRRETIGNNARKCFLKKFSRKNMGIQLCKKIKELS